MHERRLDRAVQKEITASDGRWTGTWLPFHGVALLAFLYVFFLSLGPISDPDAWWHLATGKWTLEQGTLPGPEDPFSYTSPSPLTDAQVRGLRSQWLGQLALYTVYRIGGYGGVALFRSLLILLPFVYIYRSATRRGLHPLLTVPLLLLPLLLISLTMFNTFERPQAFSFLLALMVYVLLDGARSRPQGASLWLLPAVMLLWANLHGGYIIGVAVIVLFVVGDVCSRLLAKWGIRGVERPLLAPVPFYLAAVAAVFVTFLNPGGGALLEVLWRNTLRVLLPGGGVVSEGGKFMSEVIEYMPLWVIYHRYGLPWPLYIAGFYVAGAVLLVGKYVTMKKVNLSEALVFLFIVFFGVSYARGVNFALILVSLMLSGAIAATGGWRRLAVPVALLAVCFFLVVHIGQMAPGKLAPRVPKRWVEASYPEEAVRFVKEHGVRGPMFNHLGWGGYLIWMAYPEHRVFIDGRELSMEVASAYARVMRTEPAWDRLLDSYGVNSLLLPVITRAGSASPLVLALAEEDPGRWALVHLESNAAVFVKNTDENRPVIRCCKISPAVLFGLVLDATGPRVAARPGHPDILFSRAVALYGLGKPDDAEKILRSLPPSPLKERYLKKIHDGRNG
jgi:hypothetical protein